MKSLFMLPILISLLALSACATQTTKTLYYTLPIVKATAMEPQPTKQLILAPIELADFLQQPGIVLQLDDISIHAAQHHQWADSLSSQLKRSLRDHLQAESTQYRVMSSTIAAKSASAYILQIAFDQFQGRFDGQAVVSGQWQLLTSQGELVKMERFTLTEALPAEGYPALVRTLASTIETLSSSIAKQLP